MSRKCKWTGPETRGAARRGWVRADVAVLGVLLAIVPWGAAGPVAAQEGPSLYQLEDRYREAVEEYEWARAAVAVRRQDWERELEALDLAREAGDDAYDAAQRRFLEISSELNRAERRERETLDAAEEARGRLLAKLDERREELEDRYAVATTAAEQGRIEALLRDVAYQARSLEEESLAPDPNLEIFTTSITFDPRDGAPLLRAKAAMLDRRTQQADSAIARLDRRIDQLLNLQRVERSSGDFQASVGRFGDDRIPTGPPRAGAGREEGLPADSLEAQEAVPLEQQIEEARRLREQLMAFREEVARRAEEFRERLRRITA